MATAKPHPKPLDIVIKTTRRDLHTYQQLQRDIERHSKLHGNVYVIVNPPDAACYAEVVSPQFTLVPTEEILKLYGHHGGMADDWHTQQIIKILAAAMVAHGQYIILDANTLINFDFDENHFCRAGYYLYAAGDNSDDEWEVRARKFLRLNPEGHLFGFRSVNQIFYKANVMAMIRYLEKLYGADIVTVLSTPAEVWTEFKIYGYFCRSVLKTSGHFFQRSDDVISMNKANGDVEGFAKWLRHARPLMVKLYQSRPSYRLTDSEYDAALELIKRAYV
ncbi:MAG TPA: DUF6492 family protein [Pyrinomonadaceae bacterium]|nr:DUF6492 family protein [Pyrinomonadaceae bacterium]